MKNNLENSTGSKILEILARTKFYAASLKI